MGLDITHNAFSGSYGAFHRFRQAVALAAGSSYPPHASPLIIDGCVVEEPDPEVFYLSDKVAPSTHPGLHAFFASGDDAAEFSPDLCKSMADELEQLLPAIDALTLPEVGHVARDGGFAKMARRYIAGCRAAHAAGEPLVYS